MKKQRRIPKPNERKKSIAKPDKNREPEPSRRSVLRTLRNAAIAVPLIGVAGYYSVHAIKASIREADLGRIGKGRPSIVQIHDATCRLCQTLQIQTRSVLKAFDADIYEYLVANIKSQEGAALAVKYGVQHVTLLLFDAKGKMVEIVYGPIAEESLKTIIAAHMKR